ncbi:MAG: DUF1640 domain-containing protein [Defluviicoccus sp.]|nr:DUF1640 domain-containing protein [Defluviicoccus sp.]MDE0274464.1 DUF1640 domain-containing protein [Defluviicoccus sp.]
MTMAQSTIVFDTHEAVQELTTAGVPERQAEAHVRLQARLIEQNFATKRDVDDLGAALRSEMAELRAELKGEIETLRQETRTEFAKVRTEMAELRANLSDKIDTSFRWLIGIQVGIAAILLGAIKLL